MRAQPASDSPIDLGRRTAIVTGAARGFGCAIAARLAEAGADVALRDLGLEDLAADAPTIPAASRSRPA